MNTFTFRDADAWYKRNKFKINQQDPILNAVLMQSLEPKSVLEIGCANGWRLARFRETFDCKAYGVELSIVAIEDAKPDRLTDIRWGIAKRLPLSMPVVDMVIYGFCLYLCEPQDLFQIAAEGDRALVDGGHIIIHDFLPEHHHSRIYKHNPELRSRKMDHAQLWLAHPGYKMLHRDIYGEGDDLTQHVTILRKDVANAFPLVP